MRALITGGCGFIGSAVVRHLVRNTDFEVINLDLLTYAATPQAIGDASSDPRYRFEQLDICERDALKSAFARYRPDVVMHLAAESHVDRSIDGPDQFVRTNILGTYTLLEVCRAYHSELDGDARQRFRLHHVSTDEVYGSLGADDAPFTENSPYQPNSPYAASKAASDHLVRAWVHTFRLPTVTTNSSNNYGPWQFPEKLIPNMIALALEERPLPVYGSGENVRDWLYVDDHAAALSLVLTEGVAGETYNIGGNAEMTNIDLVRLVCRRLNDVSPRAGGRAYDELITFVTDRPGHDYRYAVDAGKIGRDLGWRPATLVEQGIDNTVRWYVDHSDWLRSVRQSVNADARHGEANPPSEVERGGP